MAPAFTLLSRFTLVVNRLYLTRVHSYPPTFAQQQVMVTQNTSKNMMMLVGSMQPVLMVKKHLHVRQMERAFCPSIRESRYLPGGTTCGDAPGGGDSDMYRKQRNKVTQTDKELRFESVLLQRKN